MDEVYQKLIDRTRAPLDLKQMKAVFGHSHRPYNHATRGRKPPELVKAVQAPSYDLTVFKIKWGNLTLKISDKGGARPAYRGCSPQRQGIAMRQGVGKAPGSRCYSNA